MIEIKLYDGTYALPAFDKSDFNPDRVNAHLWDLYLGYEDGVCHSFFVINKAIYEKWWLMPILSQPYVPYFFNEGSKDLKEAMLAKINEVVKSNGWDSFVALNASGYPDQDWCDSFKTAGTATKLGTFFIFRV